MAGLDDTELSAQMEIWTKMGIEVHLIHHSEYSQTAKDVFPEMRASGYKIHAPKDWSKIDGMPCISYCAGPALEQLDQIRNHTELFVFVNCMTWLFDKEKERVTQGLITHELYQRRQVMSKLYPQLTVLNEKIKGHTVKPYFDRKDIVFNPNRDFKEFVVGRISREDAGKYADFTLPLMETFVAPLYKHGIFLGINDAIIKKIGKLPEWIVGHKGGGIKPVDFYKKVNAIIQPCDPGHTENLPRISFEAMAAGVTLIVDNKGGFQDQVIDGETGWLCSDYKEFVYKSSRCAFEPEERKRMAIRANEYLEENWGFSACEKEWKKYFQEIGVL